MGIQSYFIAFLVIAGIVVGAIVLVFAASTRWSHRWQDRGTGSGR